MNILFCTDGSKISYKSIEKFSNWSNNIKVDIFCAIDWSFLPDNVSVENSKFAVQCTNSADAILDYSEKFLKELGINIGEKIKMCGSTVDSILEISEKKSYDFIVLGSHGKRGLQKWLGSVSQEIAAVSKISTYISKGENNNKKILFAVDNSETSQNVIEKSVKMFNLTDKEIHLATVYEIPDYLFLDGNIDSNWALEISKKQETASMLLLNDIENKFREQGLNIKSKAVLNGLPAQEIIKYIEKENIDLTVCGIRNRKHLTRFLISSVSKRVLEYAKTDVAIIRP
ncbi:MAG: universal stress protein [Candidatus Gastranaerophilaceae bacterium]